MIVYDPTQDSYTDVDAFRVLELENALYNWAKALAIIVHVNSLPDKGGFKGIILLGLAIPVIIHANNTCHEKFYLDFDLDDDGEIAKNAREMLALVNAQRASLSNELDELCRRN